MKAAQDPHARRVLRALFELAELDLAADLGLVAKACGLLPQDVARVLGELDARGLAEAERVRLTLNGLATAARVPSLELATQTWVLALKAAHGRLPSAC